MNSSQFKKLFTPTAQPKDISTALLILRLVAGIAFVLHGWGKIQNPFAWIPAQAPVQIPGFFQFLAALSEFGGGLAWILGLVMPLASFGLGFTMLVAVYFHGIVLKDPFVSMGGGGSYEPALGYLAVAILFFVIGPGKFSLDKMIFGEKK